MESLRPQTETPQETPYDKRSLHVFMTPQFLAVLTEAARIYTETEGDVGYSLPADMWHFVEWCQQLAAPPSSAP